MSDWLSNSIHTEGFKVEPRGGAGIGIGIGINFTAWQLQKWPAIRRSVLKMLGKSFYTTSCVTLYNKIQNMVNKFHSAGALFCPVPICCLQDSVLRFTKEIAVLRFELYLFPFSPPSLRTVLRISGLCSEITLHITMQFAYV